MNERFNPYYSPKNLGLEMISFEEPGLSYEYNTAIFVRTQDGRVFMASDSGCSCPTPFESYEGETQDEVTQKMERIGNFEDAWQQLRSFGKGYGETPWIDDSDRETLLRWWNSSI